MKKFTSAAETVLNSAKEISALYSCPFTGSEHVLLAMLKNADCIAYKLLTARGVTEKSVSRFLPDAMPFASRSGDVSGFSVRMRHILECSSEQANRHGSNETGTEHILLSMISEDECTAARLITSHGIKLSEIFADVTAVIGCRSIQKGRRREKESGYLKQYGKDLCALYEAGKLFPCIGRQAECEHVIRILCRKTKSNPCLLGEAGVGKTAVAEGIAALICEGGVPPALYGKSVISVDISSVLAGAKYRGDFEERFRGIINESAERGDVILFIDELHMITGAGAAEGALDAANILKQPLGRGDITVIGATTYSEYEKYIESDPALCRRFQPVMINEPDEELAYTILCGIRPVFEKHHGVTITDGAVKAAVNLSRRYIKNRYLPDKAIDLIDEAAADRLFCKTGDVIDEDDIKNTLFKRAGKSIQINAGGVREIEKELNRRICGQSAAIGKISAALMRRAAGFGSGHRPRASFLFFGPPGVGKTETCRALSSALSGDGCPFIRFDMSEYSEPHTVSSLIGSPPGYVGYGDGGLLTESVRRNPYSVVCFDNIEKAHPDIYGLFLQILEEGTLTDSRGRITDFSAATVVLISSGGDKASSINGFAGRDTRSSPCFSLPLSVTDKIDRIVAFERLCDDALLQIIKNRLVYIENNCAASLSFSDNVCEAILCKTDKTQGGRGALKAVEEFIEEPLSYVLFEGEFCGINITSNGKDIEIAGIKSLDKTAVLEYN